MKKIFTPLLLILTATLHHPNYIQAQCPVATTASELNWDHLDFLPSNNVRYTSFYPSAAFPYTQNFTIGTRTVNLVMAPANDASFRLNGENGTNTAHAGSLPAASAGDDVQFSTLVTSNCTITMTFDTEVANLAFSLFDLDNNQRVTITAINTASIAQNVTITNANGASGITLAGTATAPTATGPAGGYIDNDNRGTINIRVAAVKQIIISFNNAAGDIWLSDLGACVTGSFPNNYQQISRPFIGQPQYVLTVVNNNIYYVDPTNGNGYFLFNEPGHNRLNSMAYDPYERIVYYTYSLTGGSNPRTDKTLKKYDVDAKVISVVIPDVNTFGIPTYESGVESGSASFYNGSLYLGIEGYTGTDNSSDPYAAGRKSTIWKINFDAAGNAVPPAAQVWGVTADDGSNPQNIHDWSDFGVTNGMLIDFDGSGSGLIDYYHFNLMTGLRTRYAPVGPTPRQVSIGWDEKLYNVDAVISQYNGTNGQGTAYTIFAPLGPTIPTGGSASWGDAAGPYRPFLDFGDAPATYDPNPWSPACHDTLTPTVSGRRTKLILGPNEDVEWLKKGLTTVEDTYEDGLSFVPIFSPSNGSYQAQVSLLNNTGSNATLCAWLDFNGNGTFDASESITPINVTSAAGVRTFWLSWPAITSSLPIGYTHLRIRLTSASYGMNANNATGYYNTGEVEDYRVIVDEIPLSIKMLAFDADVTSDAKVKLTWEASEETGKNGYDVERSASGSEWEKIGAVSIHHFSGNENYLFTDDRPYIGTSMYRLKLSEVNGRPRYSNIQSVKITEFPSSITFYPNPVKDKAMIRIAGAVRGREMRIMVRDGKLNLLSSQKITLVSGVNTLELTVQPSWGPGIYYVQLITDEKVEYKQFIIQR